MFMLNRFYLLDMCWLTEPLHAYSYTSSLTLGSVQDPSSMSTLSCLAFLSRWTADLKFISPWWLEDLCCLTTIFRLLLSLPLQAVPIPPSYIVFFAEKSSVAAWSSSNVKSLIHPLCGRLILQRLHIEFWNITSGCHSSTTTSSPPLLRVSASIWLGWMTSVCPINESL